MKTRFALLGLLSLLLAGCEPEQIALRGARVWIDAPRNHSTLPVAPFQVIAHASDASGVRQMEFLANGNLLGAMNCENSAPTLATCRINWNPTQPGNYRLEARATTGSGAVSVSAPVFVSIGQTLSSPAPGADPTRASAPTLTPTLPREISPTAPSITPTPTHTTTPRDATISPTPTLRLITPTPTWTLAPVCPGAPVIGAFTVSPSAIIAGQSATLSWGAAQNATSVTIDHGIGGVATPGSRVINPQTTTTYTITATGCGGTVTRQATIIVNPAPPANTPTRTRTPTLQQPPAAPSNLRQVSRSCGTPDQIRIAWDDHSNNETGFRIYRRLRENSSSPWSAWSLRATVGANSEQYTDTSGFNKSQDVEYEVKAYNAAGESGGPNLFLSECPF